MKNTLLITIILIFVTSCKQKNKYELSENDKIYLNEVIDSIYDLDQNTRHAIDQTDSIYGLPQNSWMTRNRTYLDSTKHNKYRKTIDSLWVKIHALDDSNTRLLINLIKKYGFPNNKRTGVYKSKAYFIFVHSPQQYFQEIETLINEEYKAGRISEYKKEYIFWHINGRTSRIPRSGENGEAIWN